jgi:hypothetical protein
LGKQGKQERGGMQKEKVQIEFGKMTVSDSMTCFFFKVAHQELHGFQLFSIPKCLYFHKNVHPTEEN